MRALLLCSCLAFAACPTTVRFDGELPTSAPDDTAATGTETDPPDEADPCDVIGACDDVENDVGRCSDGIDNDGDGYADCVDFDCEGLGSCGDAERDDAACSDGVDNDNDGSTDCADLACEARPVCAGAESDDATCSDGVDNDGDAAADCADDGCGTTPACSATEDTAATCSDARDNDGDGRADCLDDACAATAACDGAALRVVTWNVQEIAGGDAPSLQGQAAVDAVTKMLVRMDADVACLNEVHNDEVGALADVAQAAGYPFVFQGDISTGMAGGLTNACLSRRPFSLARSLSSDDISSDAAANETGRDFTQVRVDIVPGVSSVTILSLHLKSGFTTADLFRRQVEVLRVADVVAAIRAERPNEAIIVMGDINEELDGTDSATFSGLPSGLPQSYRMGADLDVPATYDPFAVLADAGLAAVDARHEDSSERATRIPSGRRIDYQLSSGVTVTGSEVYDPCNDDGVDDGAPGGFLDHAGPLVPCGTAEDASDHWPVVVDYAP